MKKVVLSDAMLDIWLESSRGVDPRLVLVIEEVRRARVAIAALAKIHEVGVSQGSAGWAHAADLQRRLDEKDRLMLKAIEALGLARAAVGGNVKCLTCGSSTVIEP
jgi:hypothetical protein